MVHIFGRRKTGCQALDWIHTPHKALGEILLKFNKHDSLTIGRTLEGGVLILGDPGSGKSSLLRILCLAAMKLGVSMVIFTYKSDESRIYQELAKRAGRDDVFVYRPMESPFNSLLDLQFRSYQSCGSIEKLTDMIMAGIRKLSESSSGDSQVWASITEQAIAMAVTIYVLAGEPLTYKLIEEFLLSLPRSVEEAESESWQQTNPVCRAILKAQGRQLTDSQREDLARASQWFLCEAARMSEKTRMSILITAMSGLSIMVRGDIGQAINGTRNSWSPKELIIDQAGILIIDCPIAVYGKMAEVIQSQVKANIIDASMTRDMSVSGQPLYLVMDEWAKLIDRNDHAVMATLRDKRTSLIAAIQCVDQIKTACADQRDPSAAANALLGLPSTRFFCSCNDPATLEYAENVMSASYKTSISFSSNENDQNGQEKSGKKTSGRSHQFTESIQSETPKYLVSRLARGGHEHNFKVEAFVSIAGKIFKGSNGKASLKVKFDQILI